MPDVVLPDGRIIKNVPAGITQEDLMERLGEALPPREADRQEFVESRAQPQPLRSIGGRGAPGAGILEAGAQLGTGALAAPIAGLAGIASAALPGGRTGPEAIEDVFSALTFQPRTVPGQQFSETIQKPFEFLDRFADFAGEASGDPEDALGAAGVKTAIMGIPAAFGLRRGRTSPRQDVASRAQERGYVVDPAATAPSTGTGVAEGLGGVLKTRQTAAARNQQTTNRIAAEALGLPPETVLTPELLATVRTQAAGAYTQLRNSGPVAADVIYRRDLSSAVSRFKNKDFKLAESVGKKLTATADDMRKGQFDASSAVDQMILLRDNANRAGLKGKNSEASAWRALSDALESAVERDLIRRLGPDNEIVTNFRDARMRIAKAHTVEKALDGIDVSAPKLAGMLGNRRVPLSGDLKLIAEFAKNFPKITRVMKDFPPNFSPLDLSISAASLGGLGLTTATGLPPLAQLASALPFFTSALRPALREAALSPLGQRAAVAPPLLTGPSMAALLGSSAVAIPEED
jgi:hypothetical protein